MNSTLPSDFGPDASPAAALPRAVTPPRQRLGGSVGAWLGLGRAAPPSDVAAAATPEAAAPGTAAQTDWPELVLALMRVLPQMGADTAWVSELLALRGQLQSLAARDTDAALYALIHDAGQQAEHYSARHSLLCAVLAREIAAELGWDSRLTGSLQLAALTMNAAMLPLQDQLAAHDEAPTLAMRASINSHAEQGAARLREAGVVDLQWVEIVRLHHLHDARPLVELSTVERAARLLRRVDLFTAKLSRRGTRPPLSPVRAARECCVGPDGLPDAIGTALLKTVGLYPPGSLVQLHSGESGVVVARGPRANLPLVAVLWEPDGRPAEPPRLRPTHERRHAVRCALPEAQPQALPPHALLMACRPALHEETPGRPQFSHPPRGA